MKYAKITNGIIEQVQPNYEEANGCIHKVPDDIVCGQIQDGQGWKNPDKPPAEIELERIAGIKAKANKVIISKYTDIHQRNMLARFNELLEIRIDGGILTTEQQAEYDALKAVWQWIKDVRATSNLAEAEGTSVDSITWPSL